MELFMSWLDSAALSILGIIVVAGVLYFLGVFLFSNLVKRIVRTNARRHAWHQKDLEKRQKTLVGLVKNIWRVLVFIIASLSLFIKLFPDINLAPVFASAGVLGVAIGFGSQALVKDFLAGIFIISENQYRVGDIIELEEASGTVERIGSRTTVIRDMDGNVHYFPNGSIQHVINKTMGYSMTRFTIEVHPSSDIEKVIKLINKTGKQLAKEEKWQNRIIEPPAFVSVGEFTSAAVDLLISGKTQPSDQWSVTAEMRRRLLVELEKNEIALGTN
jgi:moderate conductance mechanosensitive channel